MRVDVTDKEAILVREWSTLEPDVAIHNIRKALRATIAVWPALAGYELVQITPAEKKK